MSAAFSPYPSVLPARPIALLCTLALAACREAPPENHGTLLVVVMDGVRLEESLGSEPSSATGEEPWEFLPRVWDELLPQGVVATQAWSLAATTTTPAHVAMMTGRRLAVTNYPMDGEPGLYRPELPVLPELMRQQDEEIGRGQAVVIANTELVKPVAHSLWPGLGYERGADFVWVGHQDDEERPGSDDRSVLEALQTRMLERPVRFALLNLHQVDRSGHYGDELDYLDDVRWLDDPIADLWAWVQRQPLYRDHTWLLVMADHGRHSVSDDDPPWRHHGCSCNGCRRIPLLLLGPGVREGATWDEPMLLTDVAPTLAALLDLPVPWADGLLQRGLLTEDPGLPDREGLAGLAVGAGHRAELMHRDEPAHRGELLLDGEPVSSPEALAVEAPTMAATEDGRSWLCFRELLLRPEELESPWVPRCLATDDGLNWEDIGAPVSTVGAYWRPVMLPSPDGDLLLVYPRNLNGVATGGAEGGAGEVSVDLAVHDGEGWTVSAQTDAPSFPTDLAAVLRGDELVVAVGGGTGGSYARHERDVWVGTVDLDQDPPRWSGLVGAALAEPEGERGWWRLERPSLRVDGDTLWLAAIGMRDHEAMAVLTRSDDGGRSWREPAFGTFDPSIAPHLSPVWLEDQAIWTALDTDSGAAWLCSMDPDGASRCIDAGTERILQLQADGEQLRAVVDRDQGWWEERGWSVDALR